MSRTPTTLVLFGITGDLAHKKILPGLFELHRHRVLPAAFKIIGVSRRPRTDEELRKEVAKILPRSSKREKDAFLRKVYYHQGDSTKHLTHEALAKRLGMKNGEWTTCVNRLFYFALPPGSFEEAALALKSVGLSKPCGTNKGSVRILIEKPFGDTLASAKKLNKKIQKLFHEDQVFRVDHYLTKEALENILVFRFSNIFFDPVWNNNYIERVELRLLETEGVEHRAAFYDAVGAIRDVGQSHLLQMLASIAMETPGTMEAPDIRLERARVFARLRATKRQDVGGYFARGQYEGYKSIPKVKRGSSTETYFRTIAYVDNPRWKDVPFYLESGKALEQRRAEIVVRFKDLAQCYCSNRDEVDHAHSNDLVFIIQPDQTITLDFVAKKPGLGRDGEVRQLVFDSNQSKHQESAYEKLLYDAMMGDQVSFASSEEILLSWKYTQSLLNYAKHTPLTRYKKGSDGPKLKVEEVRP